MNAPIPMPALAAMRRSIASAVPMLTVRQVLARDGLSPVFQPIVRLRDGAVVAHESLIRGPVGSPLRSPEALFSTAHREGLSLELESRCLREGIRVWHRHALGSRLFLNVSAGVLVELCDELDSEKSLALLSADGVSPASLLIEITEHERVVDLPALLRTASRLRAEGVQFALDDFGDGRSSLRLWAELRPEIVKIDKYFIKDVGVEAIKVQTLKGLIRLAETFGTTMVAEGIETAEELEVIRDLGIELAQGYFLGRPEEIPVETTTAAAELVLKSSEIAVFPEVTRAPGADFTVERLATPAAAASPTSTVDEIAEWFARNEALRAIAIVADGQPVGLLNRYAFLNQYSKPFFRELYGRRSCVAFANANPAILDKHTGLEALTAMLASPDQRYLTEGFIVTEGGRYVGLGTGEQLVRIVTEVRIEAARHANPLTFLPGNIPLTQHIDRLLESRCDFVACYCDLNDFKPFNDQYGYWRGDAMIRLVASTIIANSDARRDFVGHVGGDDFVVLFQSENWMQRCQDIIAEFDHRAVALFDPGAIERGGIEAEDRHGVKRFFKFTSLSIGAVRVRAGGFQHAEDVASAAASAKHRAKAANGGLVVE